MKNLILLIVAGLVAFSGFGQVNAPLYSDTNLRVNQLEVLGNVEWGSNAFRREMVQTLLFGGTIDNNMKSRSFEQHVGVNRIGFQTSNGLRYVHGKGQLGKKDSLTWGIQAGYYGAGALSYGKAVFGLAFFGNAAYLDNSAQFDNTNLNVTLFQKAGFGVVSKKTGSSLFLNVVNVQDQFNASIRKGNLTQNEDASDVSLVLRGDYQGTTGNQLSKGIGLSCDLDYRITVPWLKNETTQIQLAIQNLGVAYMHAGETAYQVDSTYHYSGFELNSFTQNAPLFGADFSLLDSLGIQHHVDKSWVKLPGFVQVMKLVDPTNSRKIQSYFGIRLYPTLTIVPAVFVGMVGRITPKWHASATLSYGGFSLVKGGLYLSYLHSNYSICLGTDDSYGMLSKQGYGQSLLIRFTWKF